MKVTVKPIVIGVLGTVTKTLVQRLRDLEIRGRVETIQTTALLSSTRIIWSPWDLKDLLSLRLQWKTPVENVGGPWDLKDLLSLRLQWKTPVENVGIPRDLKDLLSLRLKWKTPVENVVSPWDLKDLLSLRLQWKTPVENSSGKRWDS